MGPWYTLVAFVCWLATATVSSEDNGVTFFFDPNFTGDNCTIGLMESGQPRVYRNGSFVFPPVRSFIVPSGLALVAYFTFENSNLPHRLYRVWYADVSSIDLGVFEWRVITAAEAKQLPPRPQDAPIVQTFTSTNFDESSIYFEMLAGEVVSPIPHERRVLSVKVPSGVIFATGYGANCFETTHRWESNQADLSSFPFTCCRVDRQIGGDMSNYVSLFNNVGYTGTYLNLMADQYVVISTFLPVELQFISSVRVPQGLGLIVYEMPYFQGSATLFSKSIPATTNGSELRAASFKVVSLALWNQEPKRSSVAARCLTDTIGYDLSGIFPEGDYPVLPYRKCTTLEIPAGFAVVGFTRRWFLGQRFVLTESARDYPESFYLRSMKVLPLSKVSDIADDLESLTPVVFVLNRRRESAQLHANEVQPILEDLIEERMWAQMAGNHVTVSSGHVAILYSDYNFQGDQVVVTESNRAALDQPFLSIKVVTEAEWNTRTKSQTQFVGLYCPWSRVTPIFVGMNEEISSFIFPWDGYIKRITVPEGYVVIAFDEPKFQGRETYWTSDVKEYSGTIRSIRVKNASEWSPTPPTDPPITTPKNTEYTSPHGPTKPLETATSSPSALTSPPKLLLTTQEPVDAQIDIPLDEPDTGSPTQELPLPLVSNHKPNVTTRLRSNSTAATGNKQSLESVAYPSQQPTSPQPGINNSTSTRSKMSMLDIVVLCLGLIAAVILSTFLLMRRRRQSSSRCIDEALPKYENLVWRDTDLIRLDMALLPLTTKLAVGSTSTVWLATLGDSHVVIKTFLTDQPTKDEVQHLIDEIALLSSVSSKHIVQLVGAVWSHPRNLQAIVEYMNMGDLREYLSCTTSVTFTWRQKMECTLSVAEALFYLHSQQMIHRDLKSRNVLLDSTKGTKLADVGSCVDTTTAGTLTALTGTSRWMAPEMMTFKPYTEAVDVYSFGVLMSELVTHSVPYADLQAQQSWSDEEVLHRVVHEDLRPSFGADCPDWYRDLAQRCLCREAEARPHAPQLIYAFKVQLRQSAGPMCE